MHRLRPPIGIHRRIEMAAKAVQNRFAWYPEPTLETAPSRGAASLAAGWAALTPDNGRAGRRPPEH